ncbi:hypothetical protein [Microbispora sp. CA-102843]|uniref:hypothetical protein n=1 Tax=Microbispora sp. CA-102843 TaxID=3239952 RepID=UPI003D90755F
MTEALTLPACRILFGAREAYEVEYLGHRPGGDVDAVISVTPYDHTARRTYLPFRRSQGQWRPLAGLTHELGDAIRMAASLARFAGWDSDELAAVLATADLTGRPE